MNSWRGVCFDLSIIHLNGTLLLKLNSGRVKHLQRFQVLLSHIIQMILGPCAEQYVGTCFFLLRVTSDCVMTSCVACVRLLSTWISTILKVELDLFCFRR